MLEVRKFWGQNVDAYSQSIALFFFWHYIELLSLLNAADTLKGREDYILTTEEMQMNDYPLPEDDDSHADYKSTHNDGM